MRVEQIPTPALIVDLDSLEHNQRLVNDVVSRSGVKLRPHYKSNKCIQIVQMQLAAGAIGISCAKLSEARDLVEAGVEDVLIANQIVDPAKLAEAAALANCCHLGVAVDHSANIRNLETAAAAQDSVIYCLIEYDVGMKRCGVDNKEDFYRLACEIQECPHLVFEGIQAYAGQLTHELSKRVRAEKGAEIEARLKELKTYVETRGIKVKEVSGCSTATIFDHIHDTVYTEYQPGSYIFMDVTYKTLEDLGFKNALFVLTSVVSNAGGQTITDAGRKSISLDQMAPVFAEYKDCPVQLSEEHSTVVLPQEQKPVGSKMLLIPGHCCTCVNLHDFIYFVRGGKVVNKVPVTSRGKSM